MEGLGEIVVAAGVEAVHPVVDAAEYEPPEPAWFSRAGGVYIPNPRAAAAAGGDARYSAAGAGSGNIWRRGGD